MELIGVIKRKKSEVGLQIAYSLYALLWRGDSRMEISKKDWKLYREKIAGWQENYMDHLNKEYIDLLSSKEGNPSDKFWKLEERIKKDKKHPGVIIETRKSRAIFDIAGLIMRKVITYEDLADFSQELKEAIKMILDRGSFCQ